MITAMSLHPAEEICGTTTSPEGVAGGMPSSGDKGVCSSGESLTNRTMVVTSEYVKFWIPDVDDALLPTLGRRFPTLAQGIQFYMDYARASGFDVRHSTLKRGRDGAINMRYLVCSREGVKGGGRHKANYGQDGDGGSTKQRRRRISNRVKCNAMICLRKDHTGEFVISIFVEEHSHSLCSEPSRVFMRGNRKLNAAQQAFIADCIKANIGPSKGFRLYKEGAGSYANVGATNMEFHNFKRDLQQYIVGADGEMIIEKFTQKREVCGSFFFDYHLDEEQRLARLFWADPTCRSNYPCYGDVLSFDATYDTNRHMFLVFKDAQLDTIPPQYVVRRWRKQPSVEASIVGVSEGGTSNSGPNGLWIAINACAGMVGNSESRMSRMLQVLKELRQEFLIDGTSSSHDKGHSVAIQALCGVQPPTTIRIKAPAKAKNKGSGKRMKSKRELAIEESRKGARKCHLCNRYDGHDTHNCPLKDVESA
nr:protein FAR1-RELATED SEQUENCE 5-like [Ipomoea trifida]